MAVILVSDQCECRPPLLIGGCLIAPPWTTPDSVTGSIAGCIGRGRLVSDPANSKEYPRLYHCADWPIMAACPRKKPTWRRRNTGMTAGNDVLERSEEHTSELQSHSFIS